MAARRCSPCAPSPTPPRVAGSASATPADGSYTLTIRADLVHDRCPYAFGRSPSRGGSGDSAPDTAVGVFHGIRASVAHAFGSPELSGRTVMVQGAGRVGSELVGHLVEAGAKVLVSDVVEDRARALAAGTGSILVPAGEEFAAECDVFAPCATGGVLSARSIPELQCRVVAGSANNQLAAAADALALRDRGIIYAPDYVINAGGALHLVGQEVLGWDRDELDRRLVGIGVATTFAWPPIWQFFLHE